MPSSYSPTKGLMVAPAQASFEEPHSIFGQRILERNQVDEASNDGYAGCGFKLEEHTGALDPMHHATKNSKWSSEVRHVKWLVLRSVQVEKSLGDGMRSLVEWRDPNFQERVNHWRFFCARMAP